MARVAELAATSRAVGAELIAHLAEVDARRLFARAGYGSLFVYCRDGLHMSEFEAYNRIVATRAARRFPVILELLADGAVNLTTVRLLAPHLTPRNHREVLQSARGLKKRELEALVARLAPKPDVPPSVRKLPAPHPVPTVLQAPALDAPPVLFGSPEPADPQPDPPSASVHLRSRPAVVSALSPDRYKMQLTVTGDILEMFQLAKDMLRHAIPSGDDMAILERALSALLADLAKKKFALTDRPRRSAGVAPGSRDIPAEVKRAAFLRDRGRCAFVSDTGRRCDERGFLELHHVEPYAEGGPPTVENIQLRCRLHNNYEWAVRVTALREAETEWYRRRRESESRRLVAPTTRASAWRAEPSAARETSAPGGASRDAAAPSTGTGAGRERGPLPAASPG